MRTLLAPQIQRGALTDRLAEDRAPDSGIDDERKNKLAAQVALRQVCDELDSWGP